MWILENWPAVLLFTAGFLGGCASLVIARNQTKQEKSVNTALQETIGLLQQTRAALDKTEANLGEANAKLDASAVNEQQALELQKKVNQEQQTANLTLENAFREQQKASEMLTETIAADKQIISKLQDTLNHFTGGDSILYFTFEDGEGNIPQAQLKLVGEHPVPDPFVQIVDVTKAVELKATGLAPAEITKQATTTRELRTVWPESGLAMNGFPFTEVGSGLFEIFIVVPNGRYLQLMNMGQLEDKSHVFAYQLFRITGHRGKQAVLQRMPEISYYDPRITNKEEVQNRIENPAAWNGELIMGD